MATASDADDQRRPSLRFPEDRATVGAESGRAAPGRRTQHGQSPQDHNNIAPRLDLRGRRTPPAAWSCARLRHLLRPHAGHHDRHRALEQRHQRADAQLHRRADSEVPAIYTSIPTGVTLPKPTIFVFAPNFRIKVQQASLGVERALNNDLAVSVTYQYVKAPTFRAPLTSTFPRQRPSPCRLQRRKWHADRYEHLHRYTGRPFTTSRASWSSSRARIRNTTASRSTCRSASRTTGRCASPTRTRR